MYTNFTQCAATYLPLNDSIQNSLYGWTGPVRLLPQNRSTQLSTLGCQVLCGDGTEYYDWSQASSTITTWVLPVIGVLLPAPFVSNGISRFSRVIRLALMCVCSVLGDRVHDGEMGVRTKITSF